jgi:NFU1 iron-sulfur cluster scaffold homolog, mitochondrial
MSDMHTYTASDSDRIRRVVIDVDEPLVGPGRHRFVSLEQARAEGQPLAEAVLAVPGVQEVILEDKSVLVLRREDAPWEAIEGRVSYAIADVLGLVVPGDEASGEPLPDDQIFEIVERVFARDINPAVAQHGGKVELIDVQDGVIVVRMMGGCQGCGMANVTLRQGIEAQLKRLIPGLRGLRDITDHASGENPYFK